MRKVYYVETRKKTYVVVGTSIVDVKDYVQSNKRDLDLSFDMSGHFKVSLAKDIEIKNIITLDDGEIDYFELYDNTSKCDTNEHFFTTDTS
ncbi:MAG: hypothetical protein L3J43_04940 [Sulfurovum sp.]|nr:hypothetical protein [Sulfurovum sp.]